jgi:hypothetical protein
VELWLEERLDLALETPEFSSQDDDPDAVRVACGLLNLYRRLYLRRSEPHRITFDTLAARTLGWMRAGSATASTPYLSREELRRLLRMSNAEISDKTIDSVLRTIALNLSILGHATGEGSPQRASYEWINVDACTAVIDGRKSVMFFAGPTPLDRGEPERKDALFLEPRVREVKETAPLTPSLLRVPAAPFEEIYLTVRLISSGADARDELRSIFAALPVNLRGSAGQLQRVRESSHLGTFEDVFESRSNVRNHPLLASATVRGNSSEASLDGKVLVYPPLMLEDTEFVIDALSPSIVQRLGFELHLPLGRGTAWNVPSVRRFLEEQSDLVRNSVVDAVRMRGPILRRDAEIGDIVRAGDSVELGVRSEWATITATFQRTGDLPLWPEIADYPLDRLIRSILRRTKLEEE